MNLNPEQLLERFSTHLRAVVAKSMAMAVALGQDTVTPVHLLIALCEEAGAVSSEILGKFKIDKDYLYKVLDNQPKLRQAPGVTATTSAPFLDNPSKIILERAMLIAYEHKHNHVGTEHLLLGLIYSTDPEIINIFAKFKIDIKDVENQVHNILESINRFPDIDDVSEMMNKLEDMVNRDTPPPNTTNDANTGRTMPKTKKNSTSVLEIFTTDLTDKRHQTNIDPVIGREKEIERLINILCRRTKNNPVLVGEPGVGKTAIVEGLAKKISNGDVPAVLCNKKILSLDMPLLLAGTIYRGEFESRLKQIIDEIAKSPNCILFIDELHNIIGAGSSQGAMDAANILKPALARGNLRCIGATTIDEYKKHIVADPALERRFQSINIDEPTKADTLKILEGIKKYYEDFHKVKITEEALTSAVELSIKYVHDNFLPDKAIDLIDEASASVKVRQKPSALQEKQQKLEAELKNCLAKKEEAISSEKFEEATTWKKTEQNLLEKIKSVEKQLAGKKSIITQKVTDLDVAKVLENKLNIKTDILLKNDWEELDSLSSRLGKYIIGQDEALKRVIKTLRQSYLGLKNKKQPLASFLFAGPSGVGKTELAKVLARELFHDQKALIKLDMSEFSEGHATSKLLGSPAGYVGHKERNRFLDQIRERPYCVILLDEIDKAHKDVAKLLLQILDEGELTDAGGKKTYFHHAIIILTTNLGAELFKTSGIGFGKNAGNNKDRDKSLVSKLREELSPALLSRLDNVILFSPLSETAVKQIITNNVIQLNGKLKENNHLNIKLTPTVLQKLYEDSYREEEGARQVEKILQDIVQELVIDIIQKNKHKESYTLQKKSDVYQLI